MIVNQWVPHHANPLSGIGTQLNLKKVSPSQFDDFESNGSLQVFHTSDKLVYMRSVIQGSRDRAIHHFLFDPAINGFVGMAIRNEEFYYGGLYPSLLEGVIPGRGFDRFAVSLDMFAAMNEGWPHFKFFGVRSQIQLTSHRMGVQFENDIHAVQAIDFDFVNFALCPGREGSRLLDTLMGEGFRWMPIDFCGEKQIQEIKSKILTGSIGLYLAV